MTSFEELLKAWKRRTTSISGPSSIMGSGPIQTFALVRTTESLTLSRERRGMRESMQGALLVEQVLHAMYAWLGTT